MHLKVQMHRQTMPQCAVLQTIEASSTLPDGLSIVGGQQQKENEIRFLFFQNNVSAL